MGRRDEDRREREDDYDRPRRREERDRRDRERDERPVASDAKRALIIGLAIGGGVIVLIGIGLAVFLLAQRSPGLLGPQRQVVKADFVELMKEWKANPIAVMEKYKGQAVEITGYVHEVSSNIHRQTYIGLATEPGKDWPDTAHLFLDDDMVPMMKDYPKGSKITVQATFTMAQSRPWGNIKAIVPQGK